MSIRMNQCPNGHFYDGAKTSGCPYCNPAVMNTSRTYPPEAPTQGYEEGNGGGNQTIAPYANTQSSPYSGDKTVTPYNSTMDSLFNEGGMGGEMPRTMPVSPLDDNRVTIPIIQREKGFNPVVGWLVCCEGPSKGRDFSIRTGNNTIGRSRGDVVIPGDDTISKENAAYVSYDKKYKKYFFAAGMGTNLIYHNEEPVIINQRNELKAYDRITMGETTLVFIPLCGENFAW